MSLWTTTDNAGGKPKYLNASEKTATVGVSVAEAQLANNRAAGIKTPGWNTTLTYTDSAGITRNKTEVLVAFGGNITSDAADDAIVGDRTITITVQPAASSVFEGATATFAVTASVAPTTALTYQWQKQEAGAKTWSNIVDATADSYTTGALTIADDNGDKYRVQIGAADTRTVTSTAALLTVLVD